MAPMPQLRVRGTCFVLTGRMWTERRHIEQAIPRHGGQVSTQVNGGTTLVIAANNLRRDADNKWRPRGKATKKVEAAIASGAVVYHEKMLADALSNGGVSKATRAGPMDVTRTPKQQAKQARERAPEWNDEMQSRLEANMRETAELLASF